MFGTWLSLAISSKIDCCELIFKVRLDARIVPHVAQKFSTL
jgi:hypothetical protein